MPTSIAILNHNIELHCMHACSWTSIPCLIHRSLWMSRLSFVTVLVPRDGGSTARPHFSLMTALTKPTDANPKPIRVSTQIAEFFRASRCASKKDTARAAGELMPRVWLHLGIIKYMGRLATMQLFAVPAPKTTIVTPP